MNAPGLLAPEVLRLIRSEQERGYRNLALRLGLGAEPQKAYERLSRRSFSPLADLPYEDPNGYMIMALLVESLQKALDAGGKQFTPTPCFATLPSGNVSAQVVVECKTGVPVIFFEQGLFRFFFDWASLIGWACPPLSAEQLSDDGALMSMARRYTMPFGTFEHFLETLCAYASEGSPGQRIPKPKHNLPVCVALVTLMERFVMAHELAHIKAGRLNLEATRNDEFEADNWSLCLVTSMTPGDNIGWAVGYWACELALLALHTLYLTIEALEFDGKKPTWIDKTHPDPLRRRNLLRQIWLQPWAPKDGVAAARELCGMSDSLLQKIWGDFAVDLLLLRHQYNGTRPSPMWRALIDATFVAAD